MAEKFLVNLVIDASNVEPYYLNNELSLLLHLENILKKEINNLGFKLDEFSLERVGEED